jgi:HAE1 family hydrophobic/amphiphilic exporter-1
VHFLAVLSMRNRALIALVTVVIAIFGGLSLTSLKQELIPSIEFPQLAVLTNYPGATPEVVANDVSTPIEKAIQGIPGVSTTTATSSTNLSILSVTFAYGTNLLTSEQKINQAINRISSQLPTGVTPQVLTGSIGDLPIIQIAVTGASGSTDTSALAAELRAQTLPAINKIPGVRSAQLLGDLGQRVTITPDPAKLAAVGLTNAAIKEAVTQNGLLIPAGSLTENGESLTVQAGSKLTSVAEIQALPLSASASAGASAGAAAATTATTPTTIGSVATVAITKDPVASISRVDGKPALTIAVTKLPSANTVEVSNAVRADLPSMAAGLSGATFTVVFDQAPYIQQSIESLATEGLLGLFFAVIVILVFLLSVRSTLVTAISIPTSVLITFIAMQAADYTLNIITLGALTIAIGRVVDDSIVVIENIKRHLGSPDGQVRTSGTPKEAAAARSLIILEAVREVAGAITASTITTIAVFLPITFVAGTTGELFRPFALTVSIALAASLLVALTIVPVLAYWFLGGNPATVRAVKDPAATDRASKRKAASSRPSGVSRAQHRASIKAQAEADAQPRRRTGHAHPHVEVAVPELALRADSAAAVVGSTGGRRAQRGAERSRGAERAELGSHAGIAAAAIDDEPISMLQRRYLPVLRWTLRRPVVTVVAAGLLLLLTLGLTPFMKTNFLGSSGQNTLTVTQKVASGASLAAQSDSAKQIEAALLGIDGIKTVQTSIGSSGSALRDAFVGGGSGAITYSITTADTANQDVLQAAVRSDLGKIVTPADLTVSASSGFGSSSDIKVNVKAANQADLRIASDAILAQVSGLGTISQSESNLSSTRPFIDVKVDRAKAAAAGLSESIVGGLVAQAMAPQNIGLIIIDETSYTIYIQAQSSPQTTAELQSLAIPTRTGSVRLDSLAAVGVLDGPTSISTANGIRTATITATPAGDNLGTASADVQAAVTATVLPAGASASLGGVTADQGDAFGQLGIALLVAILIVYVVMVATFKSLLQPLLLLVSVPFAATGAIALQVITGIPLGVPSIIGVLMLIGIVVTNAIVLIDLVNQYRVRGMTVAQAVVEGTSRRLRPILMTALATIFALLPLAIGITGHGGFISKPLALVVIGGLISSTVLTLVVLPVLYFLVEGARERRAVRREERAEESANPPGPRRFGDSGASPRPAPLL